MTIKHILMTQHKRERLANTIDRGEAEEIFLGDKSGALVSCPMLEAGHLLSLLHVARLGFNRLRLRSIYGLLRVRQKPPQFGKEGFK